MDYVTAKQCEDRRTACPGTRAIPTKTLVTILLAMLSMLITSYVLLSASIASNSEASASITAKIEIRAEQQRIIETKLDEVLKAVNKIEGRLIRKDAK